MLMRSTLLSYSYMDLPPKEGCSIGVSFGYQLLVLEDVHDGLEAVCAYDGLPGVYCC